MSNENKQNDERAECAHDYVRCDSVCTECGEQTPVAWEVTPVGGVRCITVSEKIAKKHNGRALVYANTTPSPVAGSAGQAPMSQDPYAYAYEWDTPFGLHRDLQYGTYNGSYPNRTIALYTDAPTAPSLATDAGALTDEQILSIYRAIPGVDVIGNASTVDEMHDRILLAFGRRLLAAHPTEQRMSDAARVEWQPIETAPKDREIWAFNGEQGRMIWSEGHDWALWIWADPLLSDADPCPEQPTHWREFPTAPIDAARKAEIERQGGEA